MNFFKSLIFLILLLSMPVLSNAMDISLRWDNNKDADYYIISYGDSPGNYINKTAQIQSPATTYTFTGLEDKTYYFAVKAYNSCGNSSEFSDEVSNGVLPGRVSKVIVETCVTYEAQ